MRLTRWKFIVCLIYLFSSSNEKDAVGGKVVRTLISISYTKFLVILCNQLLQFPSPHAVQVVFCALSDMEMRDSSFSFHFALVVFQFASPTKAFSNDNETILWQISSRIKKQETTAAFVNYLSKACENNLWWSNLHVARLLAHKGKSVSYLHCSIRRGNFCFIAVWMLASREMTGEWKSPNTTTDYTFLIKNIFIIYW